MTLKSIKIFINEIYYKPPKKNYATTKTEIYHIDGTWSLDIIDLKDYGPENNRGYRYIFAIINNFSKSGCTIPFKNKNAQGIKDAFEKNLKSSTKNPKLEESDDGSGFVNKKFTNLSNTNNNKHFP